MRIVNVKNITIGLNHIGDTTPKIQYNWANVRRNNAKCDQQLIVFETINIKPLQMLKFMV